MDYSILNERLISLSDGTAAVIAEITAASSEDIPYYNTVGGRSFAPGSTAIVPSEGKLYILDTDLLWTEWNTGTKIPAPEVESDGEGGNEVEQNA